MNREITRDTALICLNGHIVNDEVNARPDKNKRFCSECGAETISKCQNCQAPIDGCIIYYYDEPGMPKQQHGHLNQVKNHCPNCGTTYPWAQRKLEEIFRIIDEEKKLKDKDKSMLKESFADLMNNVNIDLANTRLKMLLNKMPRIIKKLIDYILPYLTEKAIQSIGFLPPS